MRHLQRGDLIDPALVRLFATGWSLTRRVPSPIPEGQALRVEVGLADQRRRFVFPEPPAGIAEVAAQISEPLVFLKAPFAEDAMRAILPDHWSVERTGTMMTLVGLPLAEAPLPPGYRLTITEEDDVVTANITAANGTPAARGLLVVVDHWALHDRINVEAAHRRRGLGRAVMIALGTEAARRDGRHGILTATDMGRALYQSIGWQAQAPWTTAQITS